MSRIPLYLSAGAACATFGLWALQSVKAATPPPPVVSLQVTPSAIRLDGRDARQQIVVTGRRADGSLVDLTRTASFRMEHGGNSCVSKEGVAQVEPGMRPGKETILVFASGKLAAIPVSVTNPARRTAWSFENHVESVFSKQGCNTGACHGAAAGKGGLRLSLRAYDPEADYERLRVEGRGRRVNKTLPDSSLLLRKPSLSMSHVGGMKLPKSSLEYRVVAEWIAAGEQGPRKSTPKITGLQVFPTERQLTRGGQQQLLVTARFSDGHTEDVTHWARYSSNEEPIAKVDDSGRVTMRGVGETAITVWYLGQVTFARVSVPFGPPVAVKQNAPAKGEIDRLVLEKLGRLGLRPSPPCSDSEFIRRATLDAIGTLPTPEETAAFLADRSPNRRDNLIGALLERPEFVDYWTYKWSDLLRVNRDLVGRKGMAALSRWVRESVAENKPWDQFARELLTATGTSSGAGPANFYRMGTKPEEFSETVSQAFLGIRVQCAHCHNHPFEKWTQTDYYRMANFFARVGRKPAAGGELIFAAAAGDVAHPKLGKPLPPAPFDGPSLPLESAGDRRQFLADWMVSPKNPYFARSVVNRVWRHYLGRGLVEPVDDMRLTNPSSNDRLLKALTDSFVRDGYDLKRLMTHILRSDVYQRSARATAGNGADDRYYSRYLARRLPAEVLLDALCQVTGAPQKFDGLPMGARAISLPDTRVDSAFLDVFGRPPRQITCECERNAEPNMSQALHFINAATLNGKIGAPDGFLAKLLSSKKTHEEIVQALAMRSFSRAASAQEIAASRRALDAALKEPAAASDAARAQVYGDLFWAMLSSPEFVYNH